MKNFWQDFVGQDKNIPALLLFSLGILIFSIVGNAIYELLKIPITNQFIILLICIFLIGVLFFLYTKFIVKQSHLEIDVGLNVPQKPYVISGLSFLNIPPDENREKSENKISNLRLVFNLVEKHRPILKCLYLIVSDANGVQDSKREFQAWYNQNGGFEVQYIEIKDGSNINDVYQTVNKHLIMMEKQGVQLKKDVLLDITAGTAAMSSGLTMSALTNGCNLTYQATERGQGDTLKGKTSWQFFENRIIQIWEFVPTK